MSWGNPETASEKLQAALLQPLAWIYGQGNRLQRLCYEKSLLTPLEADVPVISVGNITCGGTGKTPVVISLAQYLEAHNVKVGIVSRGYRRLVAQDLTVVNDGGGDFADCLQSGDEPLLIAHSVPRAIVISGPDRVTACKWATERFGCKVILLDDGFQHYPLRRQVDIVLVDYGDDPERDNLLPAGRLREPLNQLKRASHIVITKVPLPIDPGRLENLKNTLTQHAPKASLSICRFVSRGLITAEDSTGQGRGWRDVNSLKGEPVVAFCGLARPTGFFSLLQSHGIEVVARESFPDHHWYTQADWERLRLLRREHGAVMLVTTQKDLVKLSLLKGVEDVLALVIDTEWIEGIPHPIEQLLNQLQSGSLDIRGSISSGASR